MGKMLGDYIVFLDERIKLNFKHKKVTKISEENNTTTWQTVIEEIYYTIVDERIQGLNSGVFSWLLSLHTEVSTEETNDYIISSYAPAPNTSSFAQSIPIRLAKEACDPIDVNWIEHIRNDRYPVSHAKLEG